MKELIKKWGLCILTAILLMYSLMQLTLYNTFNNEIQLLLDIKPGQIGFLSSLYLYGVMIATIPAGLLFSNPRHIKRLILLGVLLTGLPILLMLFTTSAYLWGIARFTMGIGNVLIYLGGLTIANNVYVGRTAFAIGLFAALGNLGSIFASTPILLLKQYYSFSQIQTVNFLLGLVLVILYVKNASIRVDVMPKEYLLQPATVRIKLALHSLKSVCKSATNWICTSYISIFSIPAYLLGTLWGVQYLSSHHHITEIQAGLILNMFIIGVLIGAPLVGYIIDKYNLNLKFMQLSSLMMIVIFLSIAFLAHNSFVILAVLFFMIGLLNCSDLAAYTMIQQHNSKYLVSIAFSFAVLMMNFVNALLQPLFGYILERNMVTVGTANETILYSQQDLLTAILLVPSAFLICYFMLYIFSKKKKDLQPELAPSTT